MNFSGPVSTPSKVSFQGARASLFGLKLPPKAPWGPLFLTPHVLPSGTKERGMRLKPLVCPAAMGRGLGGGPRRIQGSLVGSVGGPRCPWGSSSPAAFNACYSPCAAQMNSWLHPFSVAAVTKYIKLGGRKRNYSLTVLEARVQNQNVGKAMLPPEALGEDASSPPQPPGAPHSLACGSITPISTCLHRAFPGSQLCVFPL